jgi:positive regulator of sigma E activity
VLVRNKAAPGLIVLAALIAYLSLDDILRLHEKLALKLGERVFEDIRSGLIVRTWVLVYVPLLALVVVLLFRMTRDRRPGDGLVRLGLLLLGLAVAFEVAGLGTGLLADESTTWPD